MNTAVLDYEDPFLDVWSRTAPKYRRRAVVLLAVTLLMFAGLCCFTFWLRTGQYVPWADAETYYDLMWKSVNPVSTDQVTLRDFLLFPISVEQVPIQWVVMGLLLASLSSIPILVAILYRFPASVAFAGLVGGVAAMPWLGLTVLFGCAISSLRPFRLSFRYASALLGLIPVAIYFVSATREPDAVALATPFRAKLAAPWVLAVLGSCIICAIALAAAKLINYRPGGIAPLLAILFAAPVVLFHRQVGRDELEYRILESQVGPGNRHVFINRSLSDEARREAIARLSGQTGFNAIYEALLRDHKDGVFEIESANRQWVEERCEAFLRRFRNTNSRYLPNVLFLKGRAMDMRADLALLHADPRTALLQFHADVPSNQSRPVWESLVQTFPHSELAAHALYQLAQLDAREGRLDEAMAGLERLLERFGDDRWQKSSFDEPATIFTKTPAWSSLGFDPAAPLRQGRRLRELIQGSRNDPAFGEAPLCEFLSLNPRDPNFTDNVIRLIFKYPGAAVEPALAVQLALRDASISRAIEGLRQLSDAFDNSPLQAEVLYHLAQMLEQAGRLAEAGEVFKRLSVRHALSCYALDARRRLSALSILVSQNGGVEGGPP